jgi:hypothetical protein
MNPPAGVLAYYWLKSEPRSAIKLELVDAIGKVAVCAASDTQVKPVDTEAINVQAYWLQPDPLPSAKAGMHRAALNIAAPRGFGPGGTAPSTPAPDACHPDGASAPSVENHPAGPRPRISSLEPGEYKVRLTVDGKTLIHAVTVKADPRMLPKGADVQPEDDDE